MTHFAFPWALYLLLLLPVLIFISGKIMPGRTSSIRFSSKKLAEGIYPSLRARISGKLIYLRAVALSLIIVALARPQSMTEETKIYVEGLDIILALDVSTSMRALDFFLTGRRVDRLEAVKSIVSDFIDKRNNDRIGIVAFAGVAQTICPPTLDHDWLRENLERVEIGMLEDGTAIGTGIAASLNRLKDSPTKEKIVILLTDGRNNAGRISPLAAAEAARALGIRVYTIGVGTKDEVPFPFKDMFGNTVIQYVQIPIDEEMLREISDISGGVYFPASDSAQLHKIYSRIDELEKTPMEETGYNIYGELFGYFLIPGMILVFLEILLGNTVFRRIP